MQGRQTSAWAGSAATANAARGSSIILRPTALSPSTPTTRQTKSSTSTFAAPNPPSIVESKEEASEFGLADELDYISITAPSSVGHQQQVVRSDKASRVLGVQHRRSMEPIPASVRTSLVSTRSAREVPSIPSFTPTLPLTSLYVVSGLPKAPHTWTLADPDSVLGLTHSEGAVNRWWRAEVLGSTVSPGAGGGKKKKKVKGDTEVLKGAGALSKQEVGKMLSKALKVSPTRRLHFLPDFLIFVPQLSFTREVEIIASTLQPASTVNTFSFTLPAPSTPLAPSSSMGLLRTSVLSATASDRPTSNVTSLFPYGDPFSHARPSSTFLGPPGLFPPSSSSAPGVDQLGQGANGGTPDALGSTITYHGVCLTVWSHADAERSAAIRRTLEAGRSRKESAQSLVAARLKSLRADTQDPTFQARRKSKRSMRGPWVPNGGVTDGETDMDAETDGAVSESDYEVGSIGQSHNPGESTLFLPGDTVFWLPYALSTYLTPPPSWLRLIDVTLLPP
jgi:nicotinamide N-methyltransferase